MTPVFRRMVVVGLGLLGGSVALAARQRRAAERVVGVTRSEDARRRAMDEGACDEVAELEEALRGADLLVLATPVGAMGGILRRAAGVLEPGCVVSDVGSVKGPLCDTLPGLLPPGVHYVGAHPMAGSHARGFEFAVADLFAGRPCVVMDGGDAGARERVAAFWSALGARVFLRDPVGHDAEVAWVSHLPHLLAYAYAAGLPEAPDGAAELRGTGFADFTRIAHSDPGMWADILTGNRKALAAPLHAMRRSLTELVEAIDADDPDALERLLDGARTALAGAGGQETAARTQPELPTAARPGGTRERNRNT